MCHQKLDSFDSFFFFVLAPVHSLRGYPYSDKKLLYLFNIDVFYATFLAEISFCAEL